MNANELLSIAGISGLVIALVQMAKPWIKDERVYAPLAGGLAIGLPPNPLLAFAPDREFPHCFNSSSNRAKSSGVSTQ